VGRSLEASFDLAAAPRPFGTVAAGEESWAAT
jgi:hypothetical protein